MIDYDKTLNNKMLRMHQLDNVRRLLANVIDGKDRDRFGILHDLLEQDELNQIEDSLFNEYCELSDEVRAWAMRKAKT